MSTAKSKFNKTISGWVSVDKNGRPIKHHDILGEMIRVFIKKPDATFVSGYYGSETVKASVKIEGSDDIQTKKKHHK